MTMRPISGEDWKAGLKKRFVLLMASVNSVLNVRKEQSWSTEYGAIADAMIEQNNDIIARLRDEGITDFNVEVAAGQICECVVLCDLDEEYRVIARKILKSYRDGVYERDGFADVDRSLLEDGLIVFTV